MSQSSELYQQVILDHNKSPRNYGRPGRYSHHARGHNPLCGDKVDVYLQVEGGVIREAKFEGSGCAISRASSSMMTQNIRGKTLKEFQAMFEEFHNLVKGRAEAKKDHLGKLKIFSGVWEYPSRVKCAVLGWRSVQSALEDGGTVRTE